MKSFLPIILTLIFFALPTAVKAQDVAIKTNLLYWGTTTPNLSIETAVGMKHSVELGFSYNPWVFGKTEGNKKLQHWRIMPEYRYWVYEKFDGHFFGVHPFYTRYNAGGVKLPLDIFSDLQKYRYEGWGLGLGLSYGYQWYLGPHWNLEAQFGFGYAYLEHKKFECRKCGEYLGWDKKHYFGPTRIGVTFVYLFRSRKGYGDIW